METEQEYIYTMYMYALYTSLKPVTSFIPFNFFFLFQQQHSRGLGFMVFNTTFNNISAILVEETRVPGENHQCCIEYTSPCTGFKLTTQTVVVIGTDSIGSYKSNYYKTTTTPIHLRVITETWITLSSLFFNWWFVLFSMIGEY